MTTAITINAHAGWPVKVTSVYTDRTPPHTEERIIAPHTEAVVYIHSGLRITGIEEMAGPPVPRPDPIETPPARG